MHSHIYIYIYMFMYMYIYIHIIYIYYMCIYTYSTHSYIPSGHRFPVSVSPAAAPVVPVVPVVPVYIQMHSEFIGNQHAVNIVFPQFNTLCHI